VPLIGRTLDARVVGTPLNSDVLLFVAGEPDTAITHLLPGLSIPLRLFTALVPLNVIAWTTGNRAALTGDPTDNPLTGAPWHLPAGQIRCVNLVLEVALTERRHVTLLDVNRASTPAEVVERWVTSDEVFPILVRSDGARLEGEENFREGAVRRLLRGPARATIAPG
jgi:hypothetical protein